jgi:oligoribonuclease NrnB/cAMP/cGMP phosphodiesterase (DHH superfamily)
MSITQKASSIEEPPVVIFYHQECSDGFGAALSAWLRYEGKSPLTLTPLSYGDPLPSLPQASDVYILDFSLPVPVFLELRKMNLRVSMIDHHQTAQENYGKSFSDDPDIIFDMNRSGAALAWLHFHPGTAVPTLIRYIEDKDLWRWNLPGSLEINSALASYPMDFDLWNGFLIELENTPPEKTSLYKEGLAILRYQGRLLDQAIRNTGTLGRIEGGEVGFFVNSPILNSEIGGRAKTLNKMVGIWSVKPDGRVSYSLRSSDGGPDVSRIAQRFGGGGHKRAAGFIVDRIIHTPISPE